MPVRPARRYRGRYRMNPEDPRIEYLASGSGDPAGETDHLDLIRGLLDQESIWAEPPPEVVDALMASIGGGEPPQVPAAKPRRRVNWTAIAAVLGLTAVLVAMLLGPLSGTPQPVPEAIVALTGTELAPTLEGRAAVRSTGSGWWIRLEVTGLPPAPEGSYYQGWVGDQSDAVSIGTFHMRDGEDPVVLWSGVSLIDYPSLFVTLQEEGKGTQPSDRVVLSGAIEGLDQG